MRWNFWSPRQGPNTRTQKHASKTGARDRPKPCCRNRSTFRAWRFLQRGLRWQQRTSVHPDQEESRKERSQRGRRQRAATITPHSTPFIRPTTVRTCCCCRAAGPHRYLIHRSRMTVPLCPRLSPTFPDCPTVSQNSKYPIPQTWCWFYMYESGGRMMTCLQECDLYLAPRPSCSRCKMIV